MAPPPVLLPGKSHGWRSLVGCSPWGRYESDTTERLHFDFSLAHIGEGNGNPLQCSYLENPGDGGPGGLPSMGSHRVGHDWSDLAAAAAEWDYLHSSITSLSCCLVAKLCLTLCDPVDWSTPGFPVLHHLLEFAHTHVHCIGDAVQPSYSLSPCSPTFSLTSIRVFSNESVLPITWPQYWSFTFSISSSNEYSWLISFRIDWLDLLAVQGTLKSLLQHHIKSINPSVLSILQSPALKFVHDYWKNNSTS